MPKIVHHVCISAVGTAGMREMRVSKMHAIVLHASLGTRYFGQYTGFSSLLGLLHAVPVHTGGLAISPTNGIILSLFAIALDY
jgi:hypothetical protein